VKGEHINSTGTIHYSQYTVSNSNYANIKNPTNFIRSCSLQIKQDVFLNYLRNMGIKQWRIEALDRGEWASIIKEAKSKLKGP
jgi:hypothetical protein